MTITETMSQLQPGNRVKLTLSDERVVVGVYRGHDGERIELEGDPNGDSVLYDLAIVEDLSVVVLSPHD